MSSILNFAAILKSASPWVSISKLFLSKSCYRGYLERGSSSDVKDKLNFSSNYSLFIIKKLVICSFRRTSFSFSAGGYINSTSQFVLNLQFLVIAPQIYWEQLQPFPLDHQNYHWQMSRCHGLHLLILWSILSCN